MNEPSSRILVVDASGALVSGLAAQLAGHEVDIVCDAFDAIYRVDRDAPPYDIIFCDVAAEQLPAPELWAYLRLKHPQSADRIVFVATREIPASTRLFLSRVPNVLLRLPGAVEREGRVSPDESGEVVVAAA